MNRRHFLAAAGAAAATSAASPVPFARATAPPNPAAGDEDFVRLAVATITCDGFGDRDYKRAFEVIPQLNVGRVEFNTWYPRNLTPQGIEGIRRRCDERRLAPVCVQGSAFGAGDAADVGHKLWCLEAARRLGCRRVKFTGGKRAGRPALDAVIRTLRELAPAAREMGMLVLVENHANNVLENVDDYDAIFAAIDSPHVGLCLDTAHFEGAGVRLVDVVERFHARTLHVDLKDNANFGRGHEVVPYGRGVTNFDGFLTALLAKGYRGYLVIEMAHPEPKEPLLENLRHGVEMFRKYERG